MEEHKQDNGNLIEMRKISEFNKIQNKYQKTASSTVSTLIPGLKQKLLQGQACIMITKSNAHLLNGFIFQKTKELKIISP